MIDTLRALEAVALDDSADADEYVFQVNPRIPVRHARFERRFDFGPQESQLVPDQGPDI